MKGCREDDTHLVPMLLSASGTLMSGSVLHMTVAWCDGGGNDYNRVAMRRDLVSSTLHLCDDLGLTLITSPDKLLIRLR